MFPIYHEYALRMTGDGRLVRTRKHQANGDLMAQLLRISPRKTRGARSDSQRHRSRRRKNKR